MVVAKRSLDGPGISTIDGALDHVRTLFPPDAKAIILDRIPFALGNPRDRIFMESSTALRLTIAVSVASNHLDHSPAPLFPSVIDVPVHGINNHPINPDIHPETDYLLNFLLKLHASPVVLRKTNASTAGIHSGPL